METPRKRSWWRYLRLRVRGLMLVVLAVAGCLGWWLHLARVQRQAVAAIRGAGGTIWYEWDVPDDPGTPGWRRWVAEHVDVNLTSNVVDVLLSPRCGEAELAQVAQLDRLESLDVGDANMTDAGMASLGRLTRLRIQAERAVDRGRAGEPTRHDGRRCPGRGDTREGRRGFLESVRQERPRGNGAVPLVPAAQEKAGGERERPLESYKGFQYRDEGEATKRDVGGIWSRPR
jgi:hypothetical protein